MLGFFKKRKPTLNKKYRGASADLGILVFENTSDVIQAENVLKHAGWSIRVMGPPPSIQTGCDLVIEFPLIEELNILRELGNSSVSPLKVVPVTAPLLEPVGLFVEHVTEVASQQQLRHWLQGQTGTNHHWNVQVEIDCPRHAE